MRMKWDCVGFQAFVVAMRINCRIGYWASLEEKNPSFNQILQPVGGLGVPFKGV